MNGMLSPETINRIQSKRPQEITQTKTDQPKSSPSNPNKVVTQPKHDQPNPAQETPIKRLLNPNSIISLPLVRERGHISQFYDFEPTSNHEMQPKPEGSVPNTYHATNSGLSFRLLSREYSSE